VREDINEGGTMVLTLKRSYGGMTGAFMVVGLLGMASVSLAQSSSWTYATSMPTARNFLGVCTLNGKIYAVGGSTGPYVSTAAFEMYDSSTNQWSAKASMPLALSFPNICALDGKIYVFGGGTTMWSGVRKDVFVYDPGNDTWTQIEDSHHEYMAPVIAAVNGKIYLIGGAKDAFTPPVSEVNMYDPSTKTWAKRAAMPTARGMFTACVFDGKIYCFGGTTENYYGVFYPNVEVYDPAMDAWTTRTEMPLGRWAPAACTLDSVIYVVGGFHGENGCNRVDILDPNSNTWTSGCHIQRFRQAHAACALGKKIYVIGGSYLNGGTPTFLSSVEVLNTGTPTDVQNATKNNNQPRDFQLRQNYPNPFNPSTTIQYDLPKSGRVSLKLYNVLGQVVATLVDEHKEPGFYQIRWNPNVPSGIYFYRLQAGEFLETKTMVLLR
jgi:N-acetylneuraminic acid mutarotase